MRVWAQNSGCEQPESPTHSRWTTRYRAGLKGAAGSGKTADTRTAGRRPRTAAKPSTGACRGFLGVHVSTLAIDHDLVFNPTPVATTTPTYQRQSTEEIIDGRQQRVCMRTRYLIALLLLIPLVDSFVLVAIVGWGLLTLLQTVALVVLTGLLGMILVRAEGRNTLARFQRKLASGSPPTDELLDGGLLIAAGAFLLTPGLVTDLIGFLLAIPITRYPIRAALKRWVVIPYIDKQTGGLGTGKVWTFGFPDPEQASNGGNGFDIGGTTQQTQQSQRDQSEDDIVDVDFERADEDERSDS